MQGGNAFRGSSSEEVLVTDLEAKDCLVLLSNIPIITFGGIAAQAKQFSSRNNLNVMR
jgi:hypothetical protein